jgi:hypothetical protein
MCVDGRETEVTTIIGILHSHIRFKRGLFLPILLLGFDIVYILEFGIGYEVSNYGWGSWYRDTSSNHFMFHYYI